MSKPFDATLKEIVGQAPEDFCLPFRLPTTQPITTLNVDLSTLTSATDVAMGFGSPLQEVVDLNFQSGRDASIAARLLLYNAALYLRFSVPVRSVLILLRPKADASEISGKLTFSSGGNRVTFPYDVVRLWRQPVQPFLQGGIGLLPLATLCKMPPGQSAKSGLREVVQEIDRRLAELPDHAQAVRLMTASFILTGLRVPADSLSKYYDGAKIMHQSSAYDTYIHEERTKTILRLGRRRFEEPASARIKASLVSIEDLDRLERMIDSIFDVNSWKELLAVK